MRRRQGHTTDQLTVQRSGLRRFLLHLAVMVALMYAGMLTLYPIYNWVARLLGSSNPATEWPLISAFVMAAVMTVPMIPFMRWHGHSRRHIVEMAGAMALPSLAAVGLYLAGVIQAGAVAGIGHTAMVPAMLAAMLYRRGDYTSPHQLRREATPDPAVWPQPG